MGRFHLVQPRVVEGSRGSKVFVRLVMFTRPTSILIGESVGSLRWPTSIEIIRGEPLLFRNRLFLCLLHFPGLRLLVFLFASVGHGQRVRRSISEIENLREVHVFVVLLQDKDRISDVEPDKAIRHPNQSGKPTHLVPTMGIRIFIRTPKRIQSFQNRLIMRRLCLSRLLSLHHCTPLTLDHLHRRREIIRQ